MECIPTPRFQHYPGSCWRDTARNWRDMSTRIVLQWKTSDFRQVLRCMQRSRLLQKQLSKWHSCFQLPPFLCLSVCEQDYLKSCETVFMKLRWWMRLTPATNRLDLWMDPNLNRDPRSVSTFPTWRDRTFLDINFRITVLKKL